MRHASSRTTATGLTWRPHGRREPTLRDLTLSLGPGERVLLAGASGSGKSTLLRLLAGLADESLGELTGELRLPGEDRPGRAGLLLQDPTHAVVAEHAGRDVAFGPENRRRERPEIADRARRALAAVGFPYPAARRSTDLSGGELQRLALAGALALDPDLLLLDEPTAMLDPDGARTVRDAVIGAVADRPVTVVVVDHRPGDWLGFCDRMLVLGPDGRLIADGPARTVLAEQRDELLAAGVWVPGEPPPEPVGIDWTRPVGASSSTSARGEVGSRPADGRGPDPSTGQSGRALEPGTDGAAAGLRHRAGPATDSGRRESGSGRGAPGSVREQAGPGRGEVGSSGAASGSGREEVGLGGAGRAELGPVRGEEGSVREEGSGDAAPGSGDAGSGRAPASPGGFALPLHRVAAGSGGESRGSTGAATDPGRSRSARSEGAVGSGAPGRRHIALSAGGVATVLRVRGLGLRTPIGSGARPLVTGLDLELRRGDLVAVSGRSGSGKSTLLRALAGLQPADLGDLAVLGEGGELPLDRLARRSRQLARVVAWQPQHAEQQLTRRTVEAEVLATSEAIYADDPERLAAARRRAEALLVALGLDRLRGADPYQLSGGEERRVALAAAVAHGPAVVLLDEPTVGQDRQTWAAVAGVIDALRAEGTAVVVATHDRDLAERADRRLDLGGPAATTSERPDYTIAPVVEPGDPPAARCNPVALLIIALGAAIGSFFVADWRVGLITLALSLLLAPLAVRGVKATLARLVPVTLAAITVGWSALAFSERGFLAPDAWPVAAAEVTRIACLVIPGVLLIPSLPPSRLGDALAQRCKLPHRPVVAAAAGLLRLQQLLEVWRTMADVRRIRGLDPGRSPVGRVRQAAGMTFGLLVYSLRSAQQSALSMDARGFAGARRRTFALPSPWRALDWLAVGVAALLTAAPILLSLGFG